MGQRTTSFDACIITTIHPPYEQRIFARGVRVLLDAGLAVHLITPWKLTEDDRALKGLALTRVRLPRTRVGRIMHSSRVFARALRTRSRSFHFHDLDFLPFAVLLYVLKGVPVIYDCHENYELQIAQDKQWIPRGLRSALARFVRAFEARSVSVLKRCIVPVPEMVPKFASLGAYTVCIRNITSWPVQRSLVHGRDVVYSGSVSRNYGLYFLLEVSRFLQRMGFDRKILVTLRNASLEDEAVLRRAIAVEGLPIEIRPSALANRIGDFLSRGCVGLSLEQNTPEKRRAIPAKLFEYMAFGLPIVSTDNPANEEIVAGAGCGIVVGAGDAMGFARAVMTLLGDDALRVTLRENGFTAIQGRYSWEEERRKLIRFYSHVLKRPLALYRSHTAKSSLGSNTSSRGRSAPLIR
jgi:glycosyltransferase involved in cell wall biosynthesis